ncbi:uncharacterized protein [Onthophagus taurus]|uniref:uncharacterized protein n=1 Tax=Onthophagus taurus TaxID=166361 RepID=UPI0039BDDF73
MSSDIKRKLAEELHKPAGIHFKRRHVLTKGINDLYQADLVEMIPYARQNSGYRYILVVIDVFSKYAWAVPVKTKSGKDVTKAMKSILKDANVPKNLQTDQGKEFYNKDFMSLMSKLKINHYSTFSSLKASIVERLNRTLKGMKPIEADEEKLLRTVYNRKTHYQSQTLHTKFHLNDFVRISKHRGVFTKGYTPNWSNEAFKIVKIQYSNPVTYLLQDLKGDDIKGAFYTEELQRTHYPDIQLIEKILKRKGNRILTDKVTLSVDASSKGLGACVMQNNKPVAYASKVLIEAQQRYAQIEKELLAVVFGCEKYKQYIYGQNIIIETDHKPLYRQFSEDLLS